jgi:hypothetical protein
VVAVVTDNCEKCAGNQINLSANIFAELAALGLGRIAVEYRVVSAERQTAAAAAAAGCLASFPVAPAACKFSWQQP